MDPTYFLSPPPYLPPLVLVDDVDFIVEVRQGACEAAEMDPTYELTKLKKKFEIWKREFKVKGGPTHAACSMLTGCRYSVCSSNCCSSDGCSSDCCSSGGCGRAS